MPSAADYEQRAADASARARRLRELASSIRTYSAPLASLFDPLASRHLEGVWLSAAAHRSRDELTAVRQRCTGAKSDGYEMAGALDRAASRLEYEARTAERQAAASRTAAEQNVAHE